MWERLPLAAMAATILMVLQAGPIFILDQNQREKTHKRETAWIKHLAIHVDATLALLLVPFGFEYSQGVRVNTLELGQFSLRVTPAMLYDIARVLKMSDHAADLPRGLFIRLPLPLFPPILSCPSCNNYITQESHTTNAWVMDTETAYKVPVLLGECTHCHILVHPDCYSQVTADMTSQEVYIKDAPVREIG
ncbi:hypothetical protein K439DRAFT_1622367 [Ramaria rubella]|nr:hypothetical protein K439DRAFT_1622367 [Ramaria rubella]